MPNKRLKMNELAVVDNATAWRRMKALVLDSVSSPITKRVYNMALDEFFSWYAQEPRPGFTKATVSAWRVTLEERGLGSSSIIVRMSATRKLLVEATDNGLLAPEIAAGIQRVKSAKSIGVRGQRRSNGGQPAEYTRVATRPVVAVRADAPTGAQ
jgi:site-specific recombinase XerC